MMSEPERTNAARDLAELREISERLLLSGLRERDAAAQLDRQLAFSGAITASLGEGIAALERGDQITFVNPVAARLLGWTAAELIGQEIGVLLPMPPAIDDPLLAALATGTAEQRDDAVFACREGGVRAVAYTAMPLVADDQRTGMVITFHDIAECQRAEGERAGMLAQVNAALAFRTRFLAITAHELKMPLTVIKSHAQMSHRRVQAGDSARLLTALDIIARQADRMTQLINSVEGIGSTFTVALPLLLA